MMTPTTTETSSRATASTVPSYSACWVRSELGTQVPSKHAWRDAQVTIDSTRPEDFERYLSETRSAKLAVVFVSGDEVGALPVLQALRARPELERTRVFLVRPEAKRLPSDQNGRFDIEDHLPSDLSAGEFLMAVERGVRAFRALGTNPLIPQFYLDATFNKTFDWFETTRWDWNEVGDLSQIRRDLLTEDEIDILKESAIIEFGTLPGAHNFLREWGDEYSFSSWALSWGAEEARHSLIQCRYLQHIGIDIPAKHAMYKREPYPEGYTRAGTLMMNIISEARAAEYYKAMSAMTREPVLARIWTLLGRDEARHARAFFVFCKELCDLDQKNVFSALEMAYVWLADRSQGVKHPAGHFYPHSSTNSGIRAAEATRQGVTDAADARVLAIVRNLTGDESIRSTRELKACLRRMVC
jgi:hypothetical protein